MTAVSSFATIAVVMLLATVGAWGLLALCLAVDRAATRANPDDAPRDPGGHATVVTTSDRPLGSWPHDVDVALVVDWPAS